MQVLLARFLTFFFAHFYTTIAWSYDIISWLVSAGRWNAWILSILPHLKGPRILELGHGTGHLQSALHHLPQLGTFGLDRSSQMGRITQRRLSSASLPARIITADAHHLPYPAGAFDQIVATFPTEYIVAPQVLAEIRRVLASGGSLVLLPTALITGRNPLDRFLAWLFRVTGQSTIWSAPLMRMIENAGFSITEHSTEILASRVTILEAQPRNKND